MAAPIITTAPIIGKLFLINKRKEYLVIILIHQYVFFTGLIGKISERQLN